MSLNEGDRIDFSPLEEKIIKTIGLTGISRLKELKETKGMEELSHTQISLAVKHLGEVGILDREIIRLGGSGGQNFYVFGLTSKGKEFAQFLTGKEIVVPQKEVLLKEHRNIEIAYLFQDCVPLLKEKGILLKKTGDSYCITINGNTYPIMLDAAPKGKKTLSREEYLEMFDQMWEKSCTFYYLSTSMVFSSFLILDEIEAWLKSHPFSRGDLNTFQFFSSFMGRIFQGEGEHWDTLAELWADGLLRWSKMPPVFNMK